MEEIHAVYVTNISPGANEKTVSDFFSFCGKITKLYLKKEENAETSSAVVQFETESAAKTALLLSNALIVDRPINVLPYPSPEENESTSQIVQQVITQTPPAPEHTITQRQFDVPDEHRTKTSVLASMLAAGYILGNDAVNKAKDWDEKSNFTLKAQIAVENIKGKAHQVDQKFGISDKMAKIKISAKEKVHKLDEEFKLTEKKEKVANSIKQTVDKVQQNPTVAKVSSAVTSTAHNISNTVTHVYQDVKDQTVKAIDEKKKQKEDEKAKKALATEATQVNVEAPVEQHPQQ